MKIHLFALIALVAVVIAACGASASSTPIPAASATAPASSGAPSPMVSGAPGTSQVTPITVRDFKFDTPNVAVKGTVSLAVTNAGPTVHDLTIRDASGKILGETADLKAGTSETLTVDIPAGTYTIFCSLPGHESLGVKGTLTVTK